MYTAPSLYSREQLTTTTVAWRPSVSSPRSPGTVATVTDGPACWRPSLLAEIYYHVHIHTCTADRQPNLLCNCFHLVTAVLPGWCNSSCWRRLCNMFSRGYSASCQIVTSTEHQRTGSSSPIYYCWIHLFQWTHLNCVSLFFSQCLREKQAAEI